MVYLDALVHVLAIAILIESESFRTLGVLAGETVTLQPRTCGTLALVASRSVDAVVRTIVLIVLTLVHVLTGLSIVEEEVTFVATALVASVKIRAILFTIVTS